MPLSIPESDWKQFKKVHGILLERFSDKALTDLGAVAKTTEGTAHDRFLRAWKLINERNEDMAHTFDDFRRSTAVMQLGIMRRMGLLTDEELKFFSETTQAQILGIASL
jgi:hypothetical protein